MSDKILHQDCEQQEEEEEGRDCETTKNCLHYHLILAQQKRRKPKFCSL